MSDVAKVYRVEVRYPQHGESHVIYGEQDDVDQVWHLYQGCLAYAKTRKEDISEAYFKVGVANSAVFQDITALYETEQAIGL
jgi:hypothetical protein